MDSIFSIGSDIYNVLQQGIGEEMASIIFDDALNHDENLVEPNTIGADFYFLFGFITDDMYMDFPVIAQEFVSKCVKDLARFNDVGWYDEAYIGINDPLHTIYSYIMRLIYNGAKVGDTYCVELIKTLYKTYHFQEYRQIKKYDKLSRNDFKNFTSGKPILDDIETGRILSISRFFNIELANDCVFIYKILEKKREVYLRLVDKSLKSPEIKQETIDSVTDQVDTWIYESNNDHSLVKTYKDLVNFGNAVFKDQNFSAYYDKYCVHNPEDGRTHLIMTMAMLKTITPNREYSFDELQTYSFIRDLAYAIVEIANDFDRNVGFLLGEEIDEEILEYTKYRPSNIKAPDEIKKPASAQTVTTTADISLGDISSEDYKKELDELRSKKNKAEQDASYYREQYRSTKKEAELYKALANKYQSEHDELIQLREQLSNLQSGEQEQLTDEDIQEMSDELSSKKIVIIGGHPNFQKKMKNRFSDWTIIPTESFSTTPVTITSNKDGVFIYDQHIGHPEFDRFRDYMDKHDIKYGYLKNVSPKYAISQIYKEIKDK